MSNPVEDSSLKGSFAFNDSQDPEAIVCQGSEIDNESAKYND